VSVSIDCPPSTVYTFVANPENLPQWAKGLCQSIRPSGAEWVVDTPQGPMIVKFIGRNELGVVDHYVTSALGVEVYVPMRVLSNGPGSEVILTLFRRPDMTEKQYAADVGLVEQDLRTLKNRLER
jgi:hypothetical protein